MSSRARVLALVVGLLLVGLGVVLALNVEGNDAATSGGLVGATVRFDVETIDGERLSADALAGRTVVVNFWNTWCIPCRREAPVLEEFYERHGGEPDLVMIGVVRDDSEGAVRSWVVERDVGYEVAMDPGSRTSLAFGVTGQPETFVIGPDGRVAGEQRGEVTMRDLEVMLAAARGTAVAAGGAP